MDLSFTCEYCGEELEDPGPAFVEHMEESPECRDQYESTHEAAIKDSGNFVDL